MRMQCVLMRWEDLTAPAIMATLEMDSHAVKLTPQLVHTFMKSQPDQIDTGNVAYTIYAL